MFSPYHKFEGCRRLERVLLKLDAQGAVTPVVMDSYHCYHSALIYKLQCAKYHVDRLEDKLTTTDIQEAATSSSFMFAVNMSIDGFFYAGGSALDILAREVIAYFGLPVGNTVYFHTAEKTIRTASQHDPILSRLATPQWFNDFREYRNALTHELILASDYEIKIRRQGEQTSHSIVFPLPDDPRDPPDQRKFKRNPDVLIYVKDHLRRLLSLVNMIYSDIAERASKQDSLPLNAP